MYFRSHPSLVSALLDFTYNYNLFYISNNTSMPKTLDLSIRGSGASVLYLFVMKNEKMYDSVFLLSGAGEKIRMCVCV